MRFEDYEALIAAHGTDPSRWPRQHAELAASERVRGWLARDREVEASLVPAPLSANFPDRTLAVLPREGRARWPLMGGAVAVSLAASLLAAVFAWDILSPGPAATPDEDAWSEIAESSGFGDLYAWVEGS